MYQFSYAEIAEESFSNAREREREALERSIEAMKRAELAGTRSREAVDALYVTRSLWTILVEDLAQPENQLPEELRASLISVGLWIMRECEAIRLGKSQSFEAMIEISNTVREGLEA